MVHLDELLRVIKDLPRDIRETIESLVKIHKLDEERLKKLHELTNRVIKFLPNPMMIIRGSDKVILVANQAAIDLGAKVGGYCWRDFAKEQYISKSNKEALSNCVDGVPPELGIQCTFCRGGHCICNDMYQNIPEIQAFGGFWSIHWIKMTNDVYLHYLDNITAGKQREVALVEETRLKTLYDVSLVVAHDGIDALCMAMGSLDILLMDNPNLPPEVVESIDSVKGRLGNVGSCLRQIQRLGKMAPVKFSVLDLNKLVEKASFKAEVFWKNDVKKKGLNIEFRKTCGKIESIDGDSDEIDRVIQNLVKNAVEAMPEGGIITFETGVVGNKVFLRVTDTGKGMSEEQSKKIFDFSFSTKGAGRGLGMSSSREIIKTHKAKISVKKTAVDEGTTIEILFPFGELKEDNPNISLLQANQTPIRVLWVDDEEPVRNLGLRYVKKNGHHADIAGCGDEAISILANQSYDVLVTDKTMPGMNGAELVKLVQGKYPKMKIAVCSGGDTSFSSQSPEIKADYQLMKPTNTEEVGKMIGTLFPNGKDKMD